MTRSRRKWRIDLRIGSSRDPLSRWVPARRHCAAVWGEYCCKKVEGKLVILVSLVQLDGRSDGGGCECLLMVG